MSAPTATFVAERHVRATRTTTWLVALEEFDAWEPWLVPVDRDRSVLPAEEVVLSHEPPWRRVTELRWSGGRPCQLTLALQDHGPESHLVWGGLLPLVGDAVQDEHDQALLLALQEEVEQRADRLVWRAEIEAGVADTGYGWRSERLVGRRPRYPEDIGLAARLWRDPELTRSHGGPLDATAAGEILRRDAALGADRSESSEAHGAWLAFDASTGDLVGLDRATDAKGPWDLAGREVVVLPPWLEQGLEEEIRAACTRLG